MGFHFPQALNAKRVFQRSFSSNSSQSDSSTTVEDVVPRGYLAVYVGNESEKAMKRFVIPVSYLNWSLSQHLLSQVGKEFGLEHLMRGLTIPCKEQAFLDLLSRLDT